MSSNNLSSLSEREYKDLYKYSLSVACKYLGYDDGAYDVAQNAILSLLSSKKPVSSPFMWLKTTVKHEAIKQKENEQKQLNLLKEKSIEAKSIELESNIESDEIFNLNGQKIKRILTTEEFRQYQMLKKYGLSPVKCAQAENISVHTVKNIKRKIWRNLTAAYLLEDGWSSSHKILNYNQYLTINRFVNYLRDGMKKKKLVTTRSFNQKIDNQRLSELFHNVEDCLEWCIFYENEQYTLLLVCAPIEPAPIFIEIKLQLNKRNYLCILDAYEKKPFLIVKKSIEEIQKYKVKDKIALSEEQLISILTDKNTDI